MAMKSVNLIRTYSVLLVCLAALLLAVACGSTSPTSPDPGPTPTPTPTPTPNPSGTVTVTAEPNPVPWSNIAVDGCDSSTPNRWAWSQILVNNGPTAVTFSQRINYFDGAQVSNPTLSLTLAPGERYTHPTRWCSAQNTDHTFRTDWVGTTSSGSSFTLTGPTLQLRKQ